MLLRSICWTLFETEACLSGRTVKNFYYYYIIMSVSTDYKSLVKYIRIVAIWQGVCVPNMGRIQSQFPVAFLQLDDFNNNRMSHPISRCRDWKFKRSYRTNYCTLSSGTSNWRWCNGFCLSSNKLNTRPYNCAQSIDAWRGYTDAGAIPARSAYGQ